MRNLTKLLNISLIGGLCLSSLHFCWALLVAFGWAQPLMDIVFKLHMLNSPFQVQPFEITYALLLIFVSFIIGAFYGVLFYILKNKIIPLAK